MVVKCVLFVHLKFQQKECVRHVYRRDTVFVCEVAERLWGVLDPPQVFSGAIVVVWIVHFL